MAEVTEGCTAPIAGQEHIVSCQATQRRRGTGESRQAPAQSGPPVTQLLADPTWQLLRTSVSHEEGKSVMGSG